jgi:N-terminal acetyltransferase B complex catalytic subunit
MMDLLERVSDDVLHGWFVDLFVRVSNKMAIQMYEGMGYSVYRRIRAYYEGKDGTSDEDAFGEHAGNFHWNGSNEDFYVVTDMRKPMPRDKERRSVRPNGRDILVSRDGITM